MHCDVTNGIPILDLSFNLITIPELYLGQEIVTYGLFGEPWHAIVTSNDFAKDKDNKMGFALKYINHDGKSYWACDLLINLNALHKLELYT